MGVEEAISTGDDVRGSSDGKSDGSQKAIRMGDEVFRELTESEGKENWKEDGERIGFQGNAGATKINQADTVTPAGMTSDRMRGR